MPKKNPTIRIVRDDGKGDENPAFLIDGRRWHILAGGLENFDGIDSSVSTAEYAQYDGSYLLGERSSEVDRTIDIFGEDPHLTKDELRAEAERFFTSRAPYEVHVEWMGRKRFFYARNYKLRIPVDANYTGQRVTWTCLALDPYFLSEDEKSFNVADAKGKRGFPFASMATRWAPTPENADQNRYARSSVGGHAHVRGFAVGVASRTITIENHGGGRAFPCFEVTAKGDVTDPSVTVKDEAGREVCAFTLTLTLHEGDRLMVDFAARPTSITLNGSNVSNKVAPGSTLTAALDPGSYKVSWAAASGDASMGLVPTIRERYVSI